MKIFLSHSSRDKDICRHLHDKLVESGYDVWFTENEQANLNGLRIDEVIKKAIANSDLLLAVVSENYLDSSWAQAELSAVVLGNHDVRLFPVVIGDVVCPSYIAGYLYLRVKNEGELVSAVLAELVKHRATENSLSVFKKASELYGKNDIVQENINTNLQDSIKSLKSALVCDHMTLVLGVGVSSAAGLPDWNKLLVRILNKHITSNPEINTKDLMKRMPSSAIVLCKYLKFLLKDDFDKAVQESLYSYDMSLFASSEDAFKESNLMTAIIELARPKRNKNCVESIITLNFDDLLETAFANHNIKSASINCEGQMHESDELPIYHVHGYLPRQETIENANLVFSEDSYHSQFIDPFSWANLTQLYKFSNNVCLFVGISLSDPNLRRLLDISMRKNKGNKHFIIKKRPSHFEALDNLEMMLFEQDARSLGLDVIWVSNHDEVPNILKQII